MGMVSLDLDAVLRLPLASALPLPLPLLLRLLLVTELPVGPSGRVKAPRSVMPRRARSRAMRADAGDGVLRERDWGWDWIGDWVGWVLAAARSNSLFLHVRFI